VSSLPRGPVIDGLVLGMLAAGLTVNAMAFSSAASAEPCTESTYYGCVVDPHAPLPEPPPGVSSDYGVPAWTPGVEVCTPLAGHEISVGPVCI
jgi:hypothetical protein